MPQATFMQLILGIVVTTKLIFMSMGRLGIFGIADREMLKRQFWSVLSQPPQVGTGW